MDRKKLLVVLALVIVLLAGATVGLYLWDGKKDESNADTNANTDTIYAYKLDDENAQVTDIDVVMPDDSFGFSLIGEDKWEMKNLPDIELQNYLVTMLASNLKSITANELVEKNAENLEQYGLEEAEYKISFTAGDVHKSFLCGNKLPVGDYYYFRDSENRDVYAIYSTTKETFFKLRAGYRNTDILKISTDDIKRVTVTKSTGIVDIQKIENPEKINGYSLAAYEMLSPVKVSLDDSMISQEITEKIKAITYVSLAGDNENLANYGLDKPYADLYIENTEGESQTLHIGNKNGENYYACTDNSKTVYEVSSDAQLVDIEPFKLVNKFVNILDIQRCDRIEIESADDKVDINVDGKDDKQKYYVDSKEIKTDTFKQKVYQPVIGLHVTDFCNDAEYNKADVTIKYTTIDKNVVTVELVNYDDRNYAVFKDGMCSFKILKKNVTAMFKSINECR